MNGYDIQSTLLYLKIFYITICKEIHYNDLCTCFDTGTVLGCLWRLSCNTASLLFAILGCFRGLVLRVDTFLCRSFFFGILDVLVHCHSIPSSQVPRCVRKRERFYENKEQNAVRKPELKDCQLYDQKEKKTNCGNSRYGSCSDSRVIPNSKQCLYKIDVYKILFFLLLLRQPGSRKVVAEITEEVVDETSRFNQECNRGKT